MTTEAGLTKLLTGSAGMGGLAYAVAVATDSIPMPEPHNIAELIGLASLAYIWTQINSLKKKESNLADPTANPSGTNPPNDWLLKQLEKIAFGVDEGTREVSRHRIDFAEFRGETDARLNGLERKVDRLEQKRNTGEAL